ENITVNPTTTTTYTVTVTDFCDVSTTSSVTITVNPNPTSAISETGPIDLCSPATQELTAVTTTSNPTYLWMIGGVGIIGETNPTLTVSESGTYSVLITEESTNCFLLSAPVVVNIN